VDTSTTYLDRNAAKALIGSTYRLDVARVIAGRTSPSFYAREIRNEIGLDAIRDNQVTCELGHFVTAGILRRLPRDKGQREQHYERLDSVFWALATALHHELQRRAA
jgi:hypothetical protein